MYVYIYIYTRTDEYFQSNQILSIIIISYTRRTLRKYFCIQKKIEVKTPWEINKPSNLSFFRFTFSTYIYIYIYIYIWLIYLVCNIYEEKVDNIVNKKYVNLTIASTQSQQGLKTQFLMNAIIRHWPDDHIGEKLNVIKQRSLFVYIIQT